MSVEARREPSRARRGGDEVHILRRPARARQRRAGGRFRQRQRALTEPCGELVHRLVRCEARGIDPEVAALDVAGREEPAPALVGIPGKRQDLRLRVTIGRHGGGGGGALVGSGSGVLGGAGSGVGAMIAGGALVTPETEVPDGMLAMGTPAKVKGRLAGTPAEFWVKANPQGYQKLAQRHLAGIAEVPR